MNIPSLSAVVVTGAAFLTNSAALAPAQTAHPSSLTPASFQDDDPVTGNWSGMLSSDMMPEPVEVLVSLEMDDNHSVTGGFTAQGDTALFEGEFDPEQNRINGEITDPNTGETADTVLNINGDEMTGTIVYEFGDQVVTIHVDCEREK